MRSSFDLDSHLVKISIPFIRSNRIGRRLLKIVCCQIFVRSNRVTISFQGLLSIPGKKSTHFILFKTLNDTTVRSYNCKSLDE